jgi:hypothetical protein
MAHAGLIVLGVAVIAVIAVVWLWDSRTPISVYEDDPDNNNYLPRSKKHRPSDHED